MAGDNTRYAADARGRVTVDNPAHAAQIMRASAGQIHRSVSGFTHLPGITCPDCRFAAHAFSVVCPRCGASLRPVLADPAGA